MANDEPGEKALTVRDAGSVNPLDERLNLVIAAYRRVRLTWRLLRDKRVALWPKLIPVAALVYILSPLDLLPELGLGPIGVIDDVMLLFLAVDQFMRLVPQELMLEHARELGYLDAPTLLD